MDGILEIYVILATIYAMYLIVTIGTSLPSVVDRKNFYTIKSIKNAIKYLWTSDLWVNPFASSEFTRKLNILGKILFLVFWICFMLIPQIISFMIVFIPLFIFSILYNLCTKKNIEEE